MANHRLLDNNNRNVQLKDGSQHQLQAIFRVMASCSNFRSIISRKNQRL